MTSARLPGPFQLQELQEPCSYDFSSAVIRSLSSWRRNLIDAIQCWVLTQLWENNWKKHKFVTGQYNRYHLSWPPSIHFQSSFTLSTSYFKAKNTSYSLSQSPLHLTQCTSIRWGPVYWGALEQKHLLLDQGRQVCQESSFSPALMWLCEDKVCDKMLGGLSTMSKPREDKSDAENRRAEDGNSLTSRRHHWATESTPAQLSELLITPTVHCICSSEGCYWCTQPYVTFLLITRRR